MQQTPEQRQRADTREANRPASQSSIKSYRSLLRLLLALVAVIVLLLAMWGRFHQNATSTVNPTKSQPEAGR